ncbi:MAG: glutamine synthetase [Actinobacteria bacterium]|nr:glutamine synthetase [Actinomycetota bacterium]
MATAADRPLFEVAKHIPSGVDELLDFASAEGINRIDLKVGDLSGRLRHVSFPARRLPGALRDGVGFAGSHYGFSGPVGEDMVMVPDPSTAWMDPFLGARTMSFLAQPTRAGTQERFARDPRAVAQRAEARLVELGFGTESRWLPEFEFYLLPKGGLAADAGQVVAPFADGYHASPPRDRFSAFRARAVDIFEGAGIEVKYDHHETGAEGQMEIELEFGGLVESADAVLLAKYIVRNLASKDGVEAVFLPKPLAEASGNGLHVHFQVWDGDRPLFAGDRYGGLSDEALSFVAGILVHIRSLAAFTNPSTNSYRRLVPGYEAPVKVGFATGDRASAVRIPGYAITPEQRRFEYRPLDATANPYLAFAALLMAGLDGMERALDPYALGFAPLDEDPSAVPPTTFPRTLAEALDALEEDDDYLLKDDVFPEVLIGEWLSLKRAEHMKLELEPHPSELRMYGDI